MPKILGVKQLTQRKFTYLNPLPEPVVQSFGTLVDNFIMIVWGMSGNGKSSFLMQLINILMFFGKVLYVSLEEGFEASIVQNVLRNLDTEAASGKVEFADYEMNYNALVDKLSKKKSPKFVIIDSVQYWAIDYIQYKALKERFPRKTFVFVSHAKGKLPDGKTADKIRYDSGIKVRVEGYVAFVTSRYGGNKPYIIWEEGAKKYWGDKYNTVVLQKTPKKAPRKPKKQIKEKEEEDENNKG